MSGRDPMMDTSADRLIQEPAPVVEPARARRGIRGLYLPSQCGRLAADGSLLNETTYDYAIAPAWRDPACAIFRCWRPEVLRMVPPEARRCRLHGSKPLPPDDPFPLEGEELAAAKRAAWSVAVAKYGVPARYATLDMDALSSSPALDAVSACEEQYSCRGVILEGGQGSGKTTALYKRLRTLALEQMESDLRDVIRLYSWPELVRLFLEKDERAETLEACREADELLIDDLGAGYTKAAGFAVSLLEEVIIHREAHLYPLLGTTNLTPKQFRSLFGNRVFDRLKGEWGVWVDVHRPSFRTKKGPRAR